MGFPLAAASTRPRMTPVAVMVVGVDCTESPERCAAVDAMAASTTHSAAASRWMAVEAVDAISRSSAENGRQPDGGLLAFTHGERGRARTQAIEELGVLILVFLEIIQGDRKV